MNKRFDWMTPDEAARELKDGDKCYGILHDELEQILICKMPLMKDVLCAVVFFHTLPVHLGQFERICRAIVPEVPGE